LVLLARGVPGRATFVLMHAGLAGLVLLVARLAREARPGWRFAHTWLPMAAMLPFYEEAGLLRHVVRPADLDAQLVALELRLLGQPYYTSLAAHLGVGQLESWHALYMSYYLLLILPALLAWARRLARVREYVFAVCFTFLLHYAFSTVVPVSGPASLREGLMPAGVLVIPLMNAVHLAGSRGGMAFPSTHVAASLVAAAYGGTWFRRVRWPFLAWLALISASTVVCTYHYVLDVLVGLATGAACLAVARRLWWRTSLGSLGHAS
jgi:membrane-associated phospholipid phosphatase